MLPIPEHMVLTDMAKLITWALRDCGITTSESIGSKRYARGSVLHLLVADENEFDLVIMAVKNEFDAIRPLAHLLCIDVPLDMQHDGIDQVSFEVEIKPPYPRKDVMNE